MISIHKYIILSMTYALLSGCEGNLEVSRDADNTEAKGTGEQMAEQATEPAEPVLKPDPSTTANPETPAIPSANPLAWMAGCWETEDGNGREYWGGGLDTHMFGASYSATDGTVRFFEHMRIVRDGDDFVFSAYPMGEGPSDFPGVMGEGEMVIFENTQHDYPQRIIYAMDGAALTGTISLADGTQPNRWRYERCGG